MDPVTIITAIMLGASGNALYNILARATELLNRPSKSYRFITEFRRKHDCELRRLYEHTEIKRLMEDYCKGFSNNILEAVRHALSDSLQMQEFRSLASDVQAILDSQELQQNMIEEGLLKLGSDHQEMRDMLIQISQGTSALLTLRSESFPSAARPASSVIDETKGKSDAINQRIKEAMTLFELNKISQSQDVLLEVLGAIRGKGEHEEELVKVYNNLGVTFNLEGPEGDYDRAINYFNSALEIRPIFVKAKINLASAYLNKDTAESIQRGYDLIQTIWAMGKTVEVLHILLWAIYHRSGSPKEVISFVESATLEIQKLIESRNSILNIVAQMYLESGQIKKALYYIGKALDIPPRNPESLALRAKALLLRAQDNNRVMSPLDIVPRLNDYTDVEEALDLFKEAEKIAEGQNVNHLLPGIQYGIATSLIWLGRHAEARDILELLRSNQLAEHLQIQIEVMRLVEHLHNRDFDLAYRTLIESRNYPQIDYFERIRIAKILLYRGAPEQSKLLLDEIEAEAETKKDFIYWLDISLVNILLENKVVAIHAVNKAKELSAGDNIDKEHRKIVLSHSSSVMLRYSKRGEDGRDSETGRLTLSIDEYQREFPEDKAVIRAKGLDENGHLTKEVRDLFLASQERYEHIRETFKTQPIITYSLPHYFSRAYADLMAHRTDPEFTIHFSTPDKEFSDGLNDSFENAEGFIFDYLSLLDLSKMDLLSFLEKLNKPLFIHEGLFSRIQQELLMNEIEELRRLWNYLRRNKRISFIDDKVGLLGDSQETDSVPDDWLIKSIKYAEDKGYALVTDDLRVLYSVRSECIRCVNVTVFLNFWLENGYIDRRIYSRALGDLAERFYVFIPFTADDLLEVVMEDNGEISLRSYHLINQIFLPGSQLVSFTSVFVEFVGKLWKMGLLPKEKVQWVKFLSIVVTKIVNEADLTKDSYPIDEVVTHLGSMWFEAIENGTDNDLMELHKVIDESLKAGFMSGARKIAEQKITERLNISRQDRKD